MIYRLTFTGNPMRAVQTLRNAVARREKTRDAYKQKIKRDKMNAASWAMGVADCEADIDNMRALMVALTNAEEFAMVAQGETE